MTFPITVRNSILHLSCFILQAIEFEYETKQMKNRILLSDLLLYYLLLFLLSNYYLLFLLLFLLLFIPLFHIFSPAHPRPDGGGQDR